MPPSSAYRPDPRFFDLGEDYGDAVRAAEFPQATLRFRNDRAAGEVGLWASVVHPFILVQPDKKQIN